MTTEEHFNRIADKCRELLAIAEKRTPGKWKFGVRYAFAPDENREIAECPFSRDSRIDQDWMRNADFIANCAGPAEAGWRATIAAIELIQHNKWWHLSSDIRAAWPEELL